MDSDEFARRYYSIESLRRGARRILPRVLFDFCDGAAEDEITLRRNEGDFDAHELWPRMCAGFAEPDLSVELFGRKLALPVIIGPTGLSGALWPDGEKCAARAAAAAGTVYVQSHGSTCSIEELGQAQPSNRWFQVFLYRDRGLTQSFVERAQGSGAEALVLTVDNQVLGQRERDIENGFTIPPRITIRNAADMTVRMAWIRRMAGARITFANYKGAGQGDDIRSLGTFIGQMLEPALSWQDVDWVRSIWRGPLVLKGILHPEDARAALEHGADGIIVSNHGGRQLDTAVSSIRALPRVAEAVAGRVPVLIDGGVRRGTDIVKALALGATACLIGRPHLWGLAVAGEAGVARVLGIYKAEITRAMMLGGWQRAADLDRRIFFREQDPAGAAAREPLRLAG